MEFHWGKHYAFIYLFIHERIFFFVCSFVEMRSNGYIYSNWDRKMKTLHSTMWLYFWMLVKMLHIFMPLIWNNYLRLYLVLHVFLFLESILHCSHFFLFILYVYLYTWVWPPRMSDFVKRWTWITDISIVSASYHFRFLIQLWRFHTNSIWNDII